MWGEVAIVSKQARARGWNLKSQFMIINFNAIYAHILKSHMKRLELRNLFHHVCWQIRRASCANKKSVKLFLEIDLYIQPLTVKRKHAGVGMFPWSVLKMPVRALLELEERCSIDQENELEKAAGAAGAAIVKRCSICSFLVLFSSRPVRYNTGLINII